MSKRKRKRKRRPSWKAGTDVGANEALRPGAGYHKHKGDKRRRERDRRDLNERMDDV